MRSTVSMYFAENDNCSCVIETSLLADIFPDELSESDLVLGLVQPRSHNSY